MKVWHRTSRLQQVLTVILLGAAVLSTTQDAISAGDETIDPSVIDLPSQSDIVIAYVDQIFKLVSKTQNPTVSWARLERVKVQSVS